MGRKRSNHSSHSSKHRHPYRVHRFNRRRLEEGEYEEEQEEEYKSYSQDIIPWLSYGNFCLTWLTVVPLVSVIAIYLSSVLQRTLEAPDINTHATQIHNTAEAELDSALKYTLYEPYALDYAKLLEIREENMQKYNYSYSSKIDRRVNLSLEEFRDVYDGKWPVIISDVVPKWRASNWTAQFLVGKYGKERVAMKAVDKALSNAVSLALPLETFYKHVHEAYPTRWTYIEDELFIPMRPELKKDIGSTVYVDDDMFQLFPEAVRPWNAMLLWGTKFSRSSLHIDPYNWTGTNAVLKGRKRWKLYPPVQDTELYTKPNQKSGFPLNCFKYNSPIDAYDPDLKEYPLFQTAQPIVFDQLPGEFLIIPTGWFHQAFNVEETLAISGQVMNVNNYRVVLEELMKAGSVARDSLPTGLDDQPPTVQVKTILGSLPQNILEEGRAVTQEIIWQLQNVDHPYRPHDHL